MAFFFRILVVKLAIPLGLISLLSATLCAQPTSSKAAEPATTKPIEVDVRFRSPRSTVRWFLASINATEDDPDRLDDALACLDLSEVEANPIGNGRIAFELEHILRLIKFPTPLIPDHVTEPVYELGNHPELKVSLHRMPDGRWLFDSKTVKSIPQMRRAVYRLRSEAPKQKEESEVASEFRSPRALLSTYFGALKKDDLAAAAKCLDLSNLPSPARSDVGGELAVKLKEIIDRTAFVIYQDVPDESANEPIEAVVRKEGRIVIERQPEGPRKGQWLINQATVDSIDRLYDAFENSPIVPELTVFSKEKPAISFRRSSGLWLRQRIPSGLKTRWTLGQSSSLATYQIIGLALLVLLVYPVYRIVVWSSVRLFVLAFRYRSEPIDKDVLHLWSRPIGVMAAVWMLIQGVKALDLQHELAAQILMFLIPGFWVALTAFLYRSVDPLIQLVLGSTATLKDPGARVAMGFPVLALVLKISAIGFGLSYLLELFDVDVTTALAGLGIGGLAFALAAQDSLKNFFGSIMLISDRTFRVGDLIRIGAHEGVVESVGLRSTRIRGLDNSLLTVPNSDLTTEHVSNHGAKRFRQYRATVAIGYSTTIEKVIAFRDGIVDIVKQHPLVLRDKYTIAVNDFGSNSLAILLRIYFDAPDDRSELQAREEIIVAIMRLAETIGITLGESQ